MSENKSSNSEQNTERLSESQDKHVENESEHDSPQNTNQITSNQSAEPIMTDKTVADQQISSPVKNEPIIIKQSGGKGMAFGAVVLSLLALGASGFLFIQGQNALKSIDTVWSQKMNDAGLGQSRNSQLLQDSLLQQGYLKESLGELNQSAGKNHKDIENLNNVYQELIKGRDAWLVNETEYALNIANQQLILTGNVVGASSAMESLLNRLNQFDKPQLLPIKKAISEDLANLQNTPYVDVASASLRLDRLESAVSSLPLLIESTVRHEELKGPQPVTTEENLSWWKKAWQEIKNTLGGLVQVRKLDNKDAMLISPEQSYFVRENIGLRLIDARIALLQRHSEVYRNDLDDVETTVRQYFDVNAPTVKAWLEELEYLQKLNLQNNLSQDLLKNSLNAVRQYQEQVLGERVMTLPDSALATPEAEGSKVDGGAIADQAASDVVASDSVASEAVAQPSASKTEPKTAQKG